MNCKGCKKVDAPYADCVGCRGINFEPKQELGECDSCEYESRSADREPCLSCKGSNFEPREGVTHESL